MFTLSVRGRYSCLSYLPADSLLWITWYIVALSFRSASFCAADTLKVGT